MDFHYDGQPAASGEPGKPERGTFSYDALGRWLPPISGADYDPLASLLGLAPPGARVEYDAVTPPGDGLCYDSCGRQLVVDPIPYRTNMMYDGIGPQADQPLIVPARPIDGAREAP